MCGVPSENWRGLACGRGTRPARFLPICLGLICLGPLPGPWLAARATSSLTPACATAGRGDDEGQ
jgi:hypothetical protein